MRDRLKSGLLPVLLVSGALLALGCGGGDDDPEAVCGNGVIEAEEQCDGANLNEQTCVTKGFDGGTLTCTADCKFDTSGCTDAPADCGNGVVDVGEQCDGANLNEQTCETQGFDGGTLSCTAICQFDTTGCTKIGPDCGNGEIDGDEQCDGTNLNEQSCETQGFDGGTLGCTATCQFDTTGCTKIGPDCGNGEIDEGEQCDGTNLNEQTCETQGFDGGTLGCTATCQFDTTSCTKIESDCGNGEIDEGEQCDGANLNEQSCETQGFDGGTLSCNEDCQFDTSGCTTITKVGVGEPCTRDIECESDLCLTEVLHGFPSGYCVTPCNEDASCDDANAICVDTFLGQLCLRVCTPGGSDCRDTYNCVPIEEGVGACGPACTEHSQCSTAGHCNERGFCEVSCTEDSDCPAGRFCGSAGLCAPISNCLAQGCNDPEGKLYCNEGIGYCLEDACLDNPCDGLANASGECERYFDDYRCDCNEGYIWDDDADACIAFECSAIDLGAFNGTRIEQTGNTCDGTSLYNAGGSGTWTCTRYATRDKELVYKLTVPAGDAVEVRMVPTDFDASLWVTTRCDDVLGLKCVVGADDPEIVVVYNDTTEDQTYYIIADGFKDCGEFTLTVDVGAYCGNGIVDGNDQCDSDDLDEQTCEGLGFAGGGTLGCTEDCKFDTSGCQFTCQAVNLGTLSETIIRANQDTCSSTSLYDARGTGDSCTRYSTNGKEIVYELTVSAGERVLVAVDHTEFDAAIWVTPSCDDLLGAQCIVGVDASSTTSGREELVFINDGDSPKTYYIVVDAYFGCGTFTLTISSLGKCGNGEIEEGEQCDGSEFGGASCFNFGFAGGELTCSAECKLDFTNCNYGSLQPVGGPCTTGEDCASGICWDEIDVGMPGGYCVIGCTVGRGCWDPANICVNYKDDNLCAKKCAPGSSGECRDAYNCLPIGEHGNGVCWPKCSTDSQCSVVGHCDVDSGRCTCPVGQHFDPDSGACVND